MATLDLGERLTIEVVVVKLDLAVFGNEKAAIAPAGEFGDELIGRGELDVEVELIFERGDGFKAKRPEGSGSALRSMSLVVPRQPCRRAVAPPVK
jgi:hypothetical protein